MDSLLQIEDLTKAFGSQVAVRAANLSVRDGEFLTILGPSGSGKTTLLRMIAGFERPSEGRICLNGRDIVDLPVNQRPFNTVFQDYALFPHMTVFNNIAYGLKVRHVNANDIRERVERELERVALSGFGERYPDQLSGGQRQRVALARSLILNPKVLLLDEPLGALDLALRKRMQITLKAIQEKVKITFIHVTHDQEEALSISDRIAVIDLGVIQQVAQPKELYFRPNNEFVARFMGENNLIQGVLRELDGERAIIRTSLGDMRSTVNDSARSLSPGEEVILVVRPENIVLAGEGGRREGNSIPVVVDREVFVGSENKLLLAPEAEPSLELMMKIHSYGVEGELKAGNKIKVGWRAEDCWLVPAPTA
jgi:spermidine/putrescine transport system ATP-binding protein